MGQLRDRMGQDLFHPHLHCVVTGGGVSSDGQRWIAAVDSTDRLMLNCERVVNWHGDRSTSS